MGRFFLTLAFLILVILLVDSGLNDPDVQPVVDRQVKRIQHQIEAISGWVRTTPLFPWNDNADSAGLSTAARSGLHKGHGWSWYWSTMLAVAVAAHSLAKSVTNEFGCLPASATICPRFGFHPVGRRL